MATKQEISELYGTTHTIKKQRLLGEIDLRCLSDNESVAMGDGKTYYWLLTKKELQAKNSRRNRLETQINLK